MTRILNIFNNTLEGFLSIVNKYGYFNVIISVIFLGFVLFSTLLLNRIGDEVVDAVVNRTHLEKKEHDQGMELRHKVNSKIENNLTAILLKTGADMVMVLEMHNGVNNINGLPFVYVDATYSKYLDGIIPVDTDYINLNMSRFYFFTHAIKHHTWGGTVEDVKLFDNKFSGRMLSNGINYVYVSTMYGEYFPFGFIIIGFGENSEGLNKTNIDKVMTTYTQKISTLLNPNKD